MRSLEQIKIIKGSISDPFCVENFLSTEEIISLVNLFEMQQIKPNKIYKNTGPVTLDIRLFYDNKIIQKIFKSLIEHIGNFEITAGFFFWTNYPHIIHNDDIFDLPTNIYKGITLPLKIYGEGIPKLFFFDQFYFHGPSKFFKGESDVPTFYNKQIYSYENVDSLREGMHIDKNTRLKYFSHVKDKWLEGLSLWGEVDWIPGNAIVFDSTRIHCASDFRTLGITAKLGISIFTKKI